MLQPTDLITIDLITGHASHSLAEGVFEDGERGLLLSSAIRMEDVEREVIEAGCNAQATTDRCLQRCCAQQVRPRGIWSTWWQRACWPLRGRTYVTKTHRCTWIGRRKRMGTMTVRDIAVTDTALGNSKQVDCSKKWRKNFWNCNETHTAHISIQGFWRNVLPSSTSSFLNIAFTFSVAGRQRVADGIWFDVCLLCWKDYIKWRHTQEALNTRDRKTGESDERWLDSDVDDDINWKWWVDRGWTGNERSCWSVKIDGCSIVCWKDE